MRMTAIATGGRPEESAKMVGWVEAMVEFAIVYIPTQRPNQRGPVHPLDIARYTSHPDLVKWLDQMTSLAESAVAKGDALNALEFWFNRYQTLLSAIIALAAAIIAAMLVSGQLKEARRQNQQGQLDHLRQRSIELENERTQIYELTSSISLMADALAAYHADPPTAGGADGYRVMQLKNAETYLNNMIERFIRDVGPVWGDATIQKARSTCRDDAQMFSVELAKFTQNIVSGSPISIVTGNEIALKLVPYKTSVFNAATVIHQGIVGEQQKTGTKIAALESRLFK